MYQPHQSEPIIQTPAASDPVTLADAKAYCLVNGTTDDALISGFISGATDYVQRRVGQQFITATFLQTWDVLNPWMQWDRGRTWDRYNGGNFCNWQTHLHLDRTPVQSITSLQYYDVNGVLQTIDPSLYWADLMSRPPRILPISTYPWPDTQFGRPGAVQVTYVAGYATGKIPVGLQVAIKALVKHWYDNRGPILQTGAVPKAIPYSLEDLILMYDKTGYQ